jgi:outer membrane protein
MPNTKEALMPAQRPRHVSAPAPRRLHPLAVAVGLALGLGALSAQAQSLQELYDAARGYDATYLGAKALADSTQYKAAQADALGRPTVGLSAGATTAQADPPVTKSSTTGQAVPGSGDRRGTTTLQVGVSATHPLYNPANGATISQAQRSLEVSKADLETAEQDLIVRVAQAYFDVLASQDNLTTAQTSKKAISEQLASAKRNFEVGTATITDTREAQARFDLATAQELAADNDLRTKRLALDAIAGRSNVAPKPLAVPVVLPSTATGDVESWVGVAQTQHPTVRKAQLALAIAKLETEKAKATDGPTVDLNGNVGSSRVNGSGTSAPGNTVSASVGVLFKLPLYSGGALQNRIKETLQLEEKSRDDLEAARRGVAQGTRASFYGVQSLQAQVKALEAAESSSQLALEATQLGYKVGVRVNLDVLNAQTQLFNARRDLAKARYDVLVNGLKLRQAAGQLKPEDVTGVNQLLAK